MTGVVEDTYDLVLALANEYGARSFVQARQPTVPSARDNPHELRPQFHRQIAGIDDCIECWLPPAVLDLGCGGGEFRVEGKPADGAIGHLSAAAGLLLPAGLVRLQLGELANLPENKVDLTLEGVLPYTQVACTPGCQGDCHVRLPIAARRMLSAHERFSALDPNT